MQRPAEQISGRWQSAVAWHSRLEEPSREQAKALNAKAQSASKDRNIIGEPPSFACTYGGPPFLAAKNRPEEKKTNPDRARALR